MCQRGPHNEGSFDQEWPASHTIAGNRFYLSPCGLNIYFVYRLLDAIVHNCWTRVEFAEVTAVVAGRLFTSGQLMTLHVRCHLP